MKLNKLSVPILMLASSPILAEIIFDPEPEPVPEPVPPLIEVGCRTPEAAKVNLTIQSQLAVQKKVIKYQDWIISQLTLQLSGNTQNS